MKTSITVNSVTGSVNQTNGSVTNVVALKIALYGAFYEGRSAEQFISEKFRAKVDGIAIVNPNDLGTVTIVDTDQIVIGTRNFKMVHVDDVLLWGQMLVIGLNEVT